VENKFTSIKELCFFMQNYISKTKYNLKRIHLFKKNIVEFCCSCCNPKKESIIKFNEDEIINLDLESFNENEQKINYFNSFKIKRNNIQACNYRIKFIFDKNLFCFKFVNKNNEIKNLIHNHNPGIINNKNVSFFFQIFFLFFFFS